jgi:TolB-like protein
MAEGMAYLAPVAIDDTAESSAVVPPEFMKVQWTRLPGALPSPQFVEQIKRLLEAPRKSTPGPRTSATPSASPVASSKSTAPLMVVGLVAVIAIAAALYFALRPAAKDPTPAAKSVAVAPAVAPVPAAPVPAATTLPSLANDKSIAVLPLTNLSPDKENEFFADGMHEDILTNLANIPELRVVSRTSVMQYRDTKKPIPQIARELGVAYILEGSVRRSGNQVRITGQLIRAANDEHL